MSALAWFSLGNKDQRTFYISLPQHCVCIFCSSFTFESHTPENRKPKSSDVTLWIDGTVQNCYIQLTFVVICQPGSLATCRLYYQDNADKLRTGDED